ncbi:hypothetical protein DEFDS_P140 (plasmid) [Deferribacter desulfuricans SSM1]|uniref:YubB ferredoxin-like domain-containing protein n=1 Tax=Deferribacter desulfuricans (strain DSM 14783 / JCM 11476 / NBRC 101012 / SSM1) TaxID=639282 RepID=D3PEX0_DEFDS|nr:hypothetical protein [Deferribacter desulfuricans]BAI81762.1 hypothetical protein DEFDS_P140 [Deferribacter desulfuricans SSM1]
MPNWCNNIIKVKDGKREDIDKFMNGAMEKGFEDVLPIPKELEEFTENPDKFNREEIIKKYGWDNLLDWAVENWGTKWNTLTEGSDEVSYMLDTDSIFVSTAWSPPIPWIIEVSKRYSLHMELYYHEPGEGFLGKLEVKDGEIINDIYFDCIYDIDIINNFEQFYTIFNILEYIETTERVMELFNSYLNIYEDVLSNAGYNEEEIGYKVSKYRVLIEQEFDKLNFGDEQLLKRNLRNLYIYINKLKNEILTTENQKNNNKFNTEINPDIFI